VETAHDVLVALARRYAFGEVAALVPDDDVRRLCTFGQRLLDLDAEDFGDDGGVPPALAQRALACRMPQSPREHARGALESLVPAYALLLEVLDVRWRRREMAAVVATVHIMSEYLPLLAWESILGHAGDPLRMGAAVGGPGSRFGDQSRDGACQHSGAERSAGAGLRRAPRSDAAWRGYLDRQHSNVAHALAVCAAECRNPCTVITRLSPADAELLARRSTLALAFTDSPIVRLRHSAPVGHGFGVPSPAEVTEAWTRTRNRLGQAARPEDGFVLPGLASFVSALAPRPFEPDTLLHDTASALATALTR
jgi:hypothetical protein